MLNDDGNTHDSQQPVGTTTASAKEREDNPIAFLTNEDLKAVEDRLTFVVHSLAAMCKLTMHSFEFIDSQAEPYGIAVQEMARANIKGIDACIERLNGRPSGNFASEFEHY